ncbi:MAG: excinuclease ABC subunit UvrC [Bacteroidetes bacterium]|nr:MAG: excinuclease ABC subunit UvrC [Bacteroidota bacterium]
MLNKELEIKLKVLPDGPGVYQYFDKNGEILYVGKAKNLKKRVSSYFHKQHDDGKTRILVRKIRDIQYIVVDTELDALLLENNLIKKYRPKYNIQLKDDKSYPWICIKNEPFPRVFSTRRMVKDGSLYYGPYTSVRVMNTLLELFRDLYALRTCNLDLSAEKIEKKNYKVCLEYHIGKCKGPCIGEQKEEEYMAYVEEIKHILKGNVRSLVRRLSARMKELSEELAFEEAQQLKEKIDALERFQSKSTVVSPTVGEVDVITMVDDDKNAFVNYMVVKDGAIIQGMTTEIRKRLNESREQLISFSLLEFRERYFSKSKEVLVEKEMETAFPGVQFHVPQRGDKKQLLDLSKRNAVYYRLEKYKNEKIKNPQAHSERILKQIQTDLRMAELPVHIECFDNSNMQGTNAVAACVVFKNAKPAKSDYRHFNIKTVEGPNDFASMEEVVYRRYKRLLDEEKGLPQLIVIDGGKGQLSSALLALEKLDLRGKVAIIGIAKRLEEIFFPGDSVPIYLDKRSESLKVIQHLRNEAHRFGITHHRSKRSKNSFKSELVSIPGIGPKLYEKLMKHFKTVRNIRSAGIEDLSQVVGMSKAKTIQEYFEKQDRKQG